MSSHLGSGSPAGQLVRLWRGRSQHAALLLSPALPALLPATPTAGAAGHRPAKRDCNLRATHATAQTPRQTDGSATSPDIYASFKTAADYPSLRRET